MGTLLLKHMERQTKKAVESATTVFYKPSIYASTFMVVIAAAMMSPVYAGEQLTDAELASKYIEVQIRQICTLEREKVDPKKSAYITEDEDKKPATYICRTDDLFVRTIKNDGNEETKQSQLKSAPDQSSDSDSASSADSSALLAGIIQNLRSLGGGESLGVPIGVSNTGNPIGFGSESYSYKWSGNLGEIFQPIYNGSGVMAPFSVYDKSDLGYGFRAEAHFPYQIPQPTVQLGIHN